MFLEDRKEIKITLLNDGKAFTYMPHFHDANFELLSYMELETLITVPLAGLVFNFLEDEKNFKFISKGIILNQSELQIYSLIKSKKYDRISVQFKDSEPYIVEATERLKIDPDWKLSRILLGRGYEKLEVTTQDGKISFSPKTTKFHLKK